mgnify:CR=1 FL=1
MANQTIFKRYEYKYLLTADQKKDLQAYMETYMKPDTFGRNTICNLYFDTPDYLLIRRSIEGTKKRSGCVPMDGHRMTAKPLSS